MSGITQGDLARLAEPTPKAEVKQRQGPGGRMLDYVDARFVMDRLDEYVGAANWQDRFEGGPDGPVRCGIGINVEGEWVWKWDVGDPSDIEAVKGAHSDAFKRAAVKWGIARDLYGHSTNGSGRGAPPSRPSAAPPPSVASKRPAGAPASVTAPDPYDDIPNDWDANLAPVSAPNSVLHDTPPEDPREGHYGPTCPKHRGRPWKETKFGPKCTAQDPDGKNGYCLWKPSRKWIAEHELEGASA